MCVVTSYNVWNDESRCDSHSQLMSNIEYNDLQWTLLENVEFYTLQNNITLFYYNTSNNNDVISSML